MPKKNEVIGDTPVSEVSEETKPETIVETPKSRAYLEFEELIGRYKLQNPKKYALKEVELLTKLKTL